MQREMQNFSRHDIDSLSPHEALRLLRYAESCIGNRDRPRVIEALSSVFRRNRATGAGAGADESTSWLTSLLLPDLYASMASGPDPGGMTETSATASQQQFGLAPSSSGFREREELVRMRRPFPPASLPPVQQPPPVDDRRSSLIKQRLRADVTVHLHAVRVAVFDSSSKPEDNSPEDEVFLSDLIVQGKLVHEVKSFTVPVSSGAAGAAAAAAATR